MLSSQAIHEEINFANATIKKEDAKTEELLKVVVKLLTLELKLLHNIRTNQTIELKHLGIELKEPKKEDEESK